MRMYRRSLAMFLALAMIFGMLNATVFAASTESLSLVPSEVVIVDGTEDKTVSVKFTTDEAISVALIQGEFSVKETESTSYVSLTGYEVPFTEDANNNFTLADGSFIYCDDANFVGYDVAVDGNIVTAVYTVDKNAPADDYTVELHLVCIDGDVSADEVTYTATIEVREAIEPAPEAPSDDPYTAEITASTDTVVNGDTILVNVNVDGTVGKFNSAMIDVEYDPAYMSFVSGVCNQTMGENDVAVSFEDDGNGIVTIVDYGEELTAGDAVYTLTFAAIDGGCTGVSIDASFSTAKHAEKDDLIAAVYPDGHLDVTINHKVTVNEGLAGSVSPSGTDSYTVEIRDYNSNYNYTVIAKVNGEEVEVVDNGDGTFTVENVTDDLVITYELGDAKSYAVNWIGNLDGIDTTVKSATYGENFSVSLPIGKAPTQTEAGIDYLATISVGNKVLHTLSSGQSYTVEGTEITDVITINVEQILTPALGVPQITVTVTGSDVKIDGTDSNWAVVDPGTDITLVLTPELGFEYTVTVGDGEPKTFDENNKFTFTAEENVTVTVQKTVSTVYANVEEYLTLDADTSAGSIWLVTITPDEAGSKLENKVYTYDGKNMFWSDEYEAYCYLAIAATKDNVDLTLINIVTGTATNVDYGMDVNMSGTVDVNDAQLVWNMYTIKYTDFDTMTVEKFLRADVSTDKTVNTLDAQAIIEALK